MDSDPQKLTGANQYATISESFKEARGLPINALLEFPTLVRLLGPLDHGTSSVLDLACGEGRFTRIAKARTSGRVVGIDISPEMIELAKRQGGGSEYAVGDCCKKLPVGDAKFGLVSAVFLLNYATSKEMLLAFCRNAYDAIEPRGRFIGSNLYPFARRRKEYDAVAKYGITYSFADETLHDGDQIHLSFNDGQTKFVNYYWSPQVYEWAFKEAGFVDMRWVPWAMPKDIEDRDHYLAWFHQGPTASCFEAFK